MVFVLFIWIIFANCQICRIIQLCFHRYNLIDTINHEQMGELQVFHLNSSHAFRIFSFIYLGYESLFFTITHIMILFPTNFFCFSLINSRSYVHQFLQSNLVQTEWPLSFIFNVLFTTPTNCPIILRLNTCCYYYVSSELLLSTGLLS